MKKLNIFFVSCVLFLGTTVITLAQETYSKVSIEITDMHELDRLSGLDLDVDHPEFDKQGNVSLYLTSEEVARLQFNGFQYEILIPDFRTYYQQMLLDDAAQQSQMTRSEFVADGFDLGSMGGFYTFAEMEAKLDEMKANYPNLVTTKSSIGTSVEGRPIWMVKISDNPNVDEAEPVAYFDGVHHAREPLAMATTINYMFWLLENYDTDPQVKFLVDNREIYFVPIVNPDGYVYNETTDPNGGGLWRKNRNPNGGSGCPGVDLNRNYGFGYAANGSCSSTDPCSGIYRGSGPFSEPEAVAVRDFLDQVEPNTAFSTHSTAGSYLMPYGFDTSPPDFEIYSEWASSFLADNDYPYGVTFQMLGYTSCGTTRDYLHSEGIYGWTPEIDGDGFWPTPSTIFDLVDENIRPLFFQSWIAGAYLDVQSHKQIGNAIPGGSFELIVEIKNTGVGASAQNTSVILSTSNPNVTVPTANTYGTVAARTKKDNSASPFTLSLDPSFTGLTFDLTVTTYQDGVENESIVVPITVGEGTVLFSDDAENGSTNWTASGNGIAWGELADDSYSGLFSFGDSPGGNAENDTDNTFLLNQSFNFDGDFKPLVTFASKWSIENDDQALFQISTDGGTNWDTLKQYTRNNDWANEYFDLTDYVGLTDVRFRFTMETDGFLPGDGFYFDDFTITTYDNSTLGTLSNTLSEVRFYPNPFSSGGFNIEARGGIMDELSEVVIYDIFGRRIAPSVERKVNTLQVSTNGMSSGVYFVSLVNSEGREITVKKMIRI
ncbi:T9SS type A sorting domain-containing protein [Aureitalea sp. L0-47]|uniref:M14 family zinc carboxypeptidase n=1 Tax=Aureitalea sp. L0-47 TaxID=2816962 RepID=UPI00223758F5|nr:M14 family zinc carboxypeptidase [Aureitalea sp. L0-47]MCW5519467.1 T9SS type A sorting domain-containing protein [Aureitalea sp. L0-47]